MNMKSGHVLTNGYFVIGDQLQYGELYVTEGKIEGFRPLPDQKEKSEDVTGGNHENNVQIFDCQGAVVGPGFIDVHVHGGGGADVMDNTLEAFETMAQAHVKHGTTRFLLTTVTASHDSLLKVCTLAAKYISQKEKEAQQGTQGEEDGTKNLQEASLEGDTFQVSHQQEAVQESHQQEAVQESAPKQDDVEEVRLQVSRLQGAMPIGLHIEGPYIAPSKKGAQNAEHIRSFSLEEVEELQRAAQGNIKLITLAPERLQQQSDLQKLVELGIVPSIGHTEATYEECQRAFEHGATHMTHLCNAMPGLHHRSPGPIAFALNQDGCTVEFIADGIHVHPSMIQLALKAKKQDEVIVVTDAMSAMGQEDGNYSLGNLAVTVKDGIATLADGTLAGSTLNMERAYQLLLDQCQIDPVQLFRMMSTTPARILGLEQQFGSIEQGKAADLVVMKDHMIDKVMVAGQWIVC
ncbi:N-acetylglucosamine-6-phosphate deacetylase [Bacillus horti]|uniref:N-acetylglucosamine-6-phosphate deacetylase n=1 Tax=Caldalkalibacillus horti TaxID=77523 RepID=A0ABT9VZA0_9BACI|nr:N-acetylglucosamine-6-phosphate deacetylase [Bacillus horti]MDQ0166302.1 N-acetylglucosamine-6-phosphate deacetylase [Bacillus horti]